MSVDPYQFEPTKKIVSRSDDRDESDDGWEDIPDDDYEVPLVEEDIEDLENRMANLNRVDMDDTTAWCKCYSCATMSVNRECLCCAEIDSIKLTKLSDGMILLIYTPIHTRYI